MKAVSEISSSLTKGWRWEFGEGDEQRVSLVPESPPEVVSNLFEE
jgi:hypothetical protein